MDRIENCISFIIGKAAQQVSRRSRDLLSPFGVTPVQYALLKCLEDYPQGVGGTALGARMVLDAASITGIIDRLTALKLVERRVNPFDRRAQLILATRKARDLMPDLDAAMDRLNRETTAIFDGSGTPALTILRKLGQEKEWKAHV